eukprot:585377-Rhodomonas_salina.2
MSCPDSITVTSVTACGLSPAASECGPARAARSRPGPGPGRRRLGLCQCQWLQVASDLRDTVTGPLLRVRVLPAESRPRDTERFSWQQDFLLVVT